MPNPTLDPHADLILELLAKKASNGEILDILLAKSVDTSQEAVRTWVNKNADPNLLKGRGKGRRRKARHLRFCFLPDHRDSLLLTGFLETALNLILLPRASRAGSRVEAAEALLRSADIEVDSSTPPWRWMLPAKSLTAVADTELLLLAYLLSDRPEPPSRGSTATYRSWLVDLTRNAARMRAKINDGLNFRFEEIGS